MKDLMFTNSQQLPIAKANLLEQGHRLEEFIRELTSFMNFLEQEGFLMQEKTRRDLFPEKKSLFKHLLGSANSFLRNNSEFFPHYGEISPQRDETPFYTLVNQRIREIVSMGELVLSSIESSMKKTVNQIDDSIKNLNLVLKEVQTAEDALEGDGFDENTSDSESEEERAISAQKKALRLRVLSEITNATRQNIAVLKIVLASEKLALEKTSVVKVAIPLILGNSLMVTSFVSKVNANNLQMTKLITMVGAILPDNATFSSETVRSTQEAYNKSLVDINGLSRSVNRLITDLTNINEMLYSQAHKLNEGASILNYESSRLEEATE